MATEQAVRQGIRKADVLTEALAERLQRIEERDRIKAELKTRKWLASEVEVLKAEILADPDQQAAGNQLRQLSQLLNEAKQEGRYEDDVSRNVANLRRELGEGEWILRRGDVGLMSALAISLDRKAAAGGSGGNSAASSARVFYGALTGTPGILTRAMAEGRVANDPTSIELGVLVAESLPSWIEQRSVQYAIWTTLATEDDIPWKAELAAVQRERWEILSAAWTDLMEAAALHQASRHVRSIVDLFAWPYPQLPAMIWEPVNRSAELVTVRRLEAENRAAKSFLGQRARTSFAARMEAARKEAEANDPDTIRRSGWAS